MAGYRDDAKAGGLTVEDDRYIKPPEEVTDPGDLPKNATTQQKSTWQTAHDSYEAYLGKKKLFDNLLEDTKETRKKLTDWVNEHMTVSEKSPLHEIILSGLLNADIAVEGILAENAYYLKLTTWCEVRRLKMR